MEALILGAGYATRLHPLTKNRPKPLLPVGDVPILERICRQIEDLSGLNAIHIVTNHTFAEAYETWMRDYSRRRKSPPVLRLHDDGSTTPETRLGAIGDLQFVIQRSAIDDDLMVIAGDNLIDSDLDTFVEFGRSKGATVGLKDFRDPQKVTLYGVVEVDDDWRVIGFEEKPAAPRSSLVGIGLYYFPRRTLPLVARYLAQGHSKDAPGYYLQWLHREIPLYGCVLDGDWYDIGDLDSYARANEKMRRHPLMRQ
jgi:glucose-1-phosphate thymidylyltransferase